MQQIQRNKPGAGNFIRNLLYFFILLCLFLSGAFWLNFIFGTGNATYLSTTASKFILLFFVFFSLVFCLGLGFSMIYDQKQVNWLLPYITIVLSGMMALAILLLMLLSGNSFFN